MHARFVSYLKDNRDQIIENWLLEAEIPLPEGVELEADTSGIIPLAFLSQAFDAVIQGMETGNLPPHRADDIHLNDFLGFTCSCKQRCFGGRVCMELHDSGLKAFLSVFDETWDADHEFNQLDRENCTTLINHALSGLIDKEIEICGHKEFRNDCPFAFKKHSTPSQP